MSIGPIISLSLPKSGTTTLGVALEQAGLKVADWRIRRHQTDNLALQDQLLGPMIYEDYFTHGDPLHRLGEFDAITEMNAVNHELCFWPQTDMGLLNAIMTYHPNVKFVLSLRDPEKVANSIMNWNSLGTDRLPKNDVPGLPRPYGGEVAHLIRWVQSHYDFCDKVFQGMGNFFAYDLNDKDVSSDIGAFLGIDLPWWGKANQNPNKVAAQ